MFFKGKTAFEKILNMNDKQLMILISMYNAGNLNKEFSIALEAFEAFVSENHI